MCTSFKLPIRALNLDILSKRLGQYRSKMSSFSSKVTKIKREIATAKTEVKSAEETVKITKEQFELKRKIEASWKKLYDKKHGSLLQYLNARDTTLAARTSYFNAVNTVDGKKAAIMVCW